MGNTATCPSDMCGANKEFENYSTLTRSGTNPAQAAHEARKVQTFHRYAEEGDVKGITMLCHLAKNSALSVDSQDDNGLTALHKAAKNGHLAACKALIKHGASPKIRSTAGSTPVDLAHRNHRHEVVAFLKKAMSQSKAQPTSASLQATSIASSGNAQGYMVGDQQVHAQQSPRQTAFSTAASNEGMVRMLGISQEQHTGPIVRAATMPAHVDKNPPRWTMLDSNPPRPQVLKAEQGSQSPAVLPTRMITLQEQREMGTQGQRAHDSATQVAMPMDAGTQASAPQDGALAHGQAGGGPMVVRDMDTQTSQQISTHTILQASAVGVQGGGEGGGGAGPRAVQDSAVQAGAWGAQAARSRVENPTASSRSGSGVAYPPMAMRTASNDDFEAPTNSAKTLQTYQPVSQGIAKFSSMERRAIQERSASNPVRRISSEPVRAEANFSNERDPRAVGGPSPIAEQSLPTTGDSTPPRFQCV